MKITTTVKTPQEQVKPQFPGYFCCYNHKDFVVLFPSRESKGVIVASIMFLGQETDTAYCEYEANYWLPMPKGYSATLEQD